MKPAFLLLAAVLVAACQSEQQETDVVSKVAAPSLNDVSNTTSHSSASGSDDQVTTQLLVDIHRNGQLDVVEALEIPGRVRLRTRSSGEFAYEVRSGARVLGAESLGDLYEMRGFAVPGTVNEFRKSTDTARVVMYVPGRNLEREDYQVVLHQVRQQPASKRITADNISAFAASGGTTEVAKLEGKDIAARAKVLKANRKR